MTSHVPMSLSHFNSSFITSYHLGQSGQACASLMVQGSSPSVSMICTTIASPSSCSEHLASMCMLVDNGSVHVLVTDPFPSRISWICCADLMVHLRWSIGGLL